MVIGFKKVWHSKPLHGVIVGLLRIVATCYHLLPTEISETVFLAIGPEALDDDKVFIHAFCVYDDNACKPVDHDAARKVAT